MEMFGVPLREHDERYRVADEWLTVMKRNWSEQDFDHDGEFYSIRGGFLLPKPIQQPHPVLVNAGSSEAGREFSARHVDFNFISINSLEEAKGLIESIS